MGKTTPIISQNERSRKIQQKAQRIIDEYFRITDWPKWFKGLSLFQINAANSIQNNLRDDLAQGTTDRIHLTCLTLGLEPLITAKEVREVMHLSHGNDLAFVWFLWQMHYLKEPTYVNRKYTENEKILLTTITHLDLITTLRALDRILPVQNPKPPILKPAKKKRSPPIYELPYFEPLRKPIQIQKKPFRLNLQPANLGVYARYQERHYVVPNEVNRWFSDYKVNPSKRICLGIINNTVGDINIDENKETENDGISEKCRKYLLKDIIKDLPMCEAHKQKRAADKSRANKLCAQKLRGCKKRLNPGENRKEVTRRKVLKNIENDVEAFTEKDIKELTKVYNENQKKLQSCVNPVTVDCNKCDNCETEYNYEEGYDSWILYDAMSSDMNISSASSGVNRSNECDVPTKELVPNDDNSKFNSFKIIDKNEDQESVEKKETPSVATKSVRKCEIQFDEIISSFDFGHCCTPRNDEVFFEAPGYHKPYKFMFEKIFNVDDLIGQNVYKAAVNKALGADLGKEEDETLLEYFKAVWKQEVEAWQKTYKYFQKALNKPYPKTKLYKYSRDYYNPRDDELMSNMLTDALNELKKDKKYVLASLPDSHKVPNLKEWILARYGLIYTVKERHEQLNMSLKLFRALQTVQYSNIKVDRIPFSELKDVTYACRNYLYERSLVERIKYEHSFRMAVMDPIATFWTAMQPYRYPTGAPRSTFYAYMPANVYSILVFKPWQSKEFRDMVQARLKVHNS